MAGKGRKRREKNYRAAHGGSTALPPPPKSSQLDALPFKLRQIISFTKHQNDSPSLSKDKKLDHGHAQNGDTSEPLKAPEHRDEQLNANDDNKNKKKRKRKEVKDLRFAMEEDKSKSQLKKKERKKKYEAKKKKHKKLSYIPKAFKISQDASHERLRLRAIEDYRSRKGWTSRPGNHRPPPVTTEDP
ncbi:hypothetical protein QL285_086619 [Trifolium repens]|nr:hypothetical protein QL285_086619 [Trifolium repens]